MKLVIDIPEQMYLNAKADTLCGGDILVKAIKNGIPLPKDHGRIADMDEAIKCIEEVKGNDAIYAIALIEWACGKRTIIEADKAESEDKE